MINGQLSGMMGHEKVNVYHLSIGYGVRGGPAIYESAGIDYDSDFDLDDNGRRKVCPLTPSHLIKLIFA